MMTNYFDLIERRIVNGNKIHSYHSLPSKSDAEMLQFSREHAELMENWRIFRAVRNGFYAHLMGEYRYLSQERRIEAEGRPGRPSCVENAETGVKYYGDRYWSEPMNLTEFSHCISEAYGQCDAAGMSGLLAGFMESYREEVQMYV